MVRPDHESQLPGNTFDVSRNKGKGRRFLSSITRCTHLGTYDKMFESMNSSALVKSIPQCPQPQHDTRVLVRHYVNQAFRRPLDKAFLPLFPGQETLVAASYSLAPLVASATLAIFFLPQSDWMVLGTRGCGDVIKPHRCNHRSSQRYRRALKGE